MDDKWNTDYLKKQANYELRNIQKVFLKNKITPQKAYSILDIGCSNGYDTNLIFKNFVNSNIMGIDIDKEQILEATKAHYGNNFIFKSIDLLSIDIDQFINCFGKFDIIYCSYVIQYIRNPSVFLNICHKLLEKNGKIIIKASDDNGKNIYPGQEILREIIVFYNKYIMPNADRFCASKCYSWLIECNFHNIEYNFFIENTVNMNLAEKNDLYYRDFAFRELALSKLDKNNLLVRRYNYLLSSIHELFQKNNFYYHSTSYIITADY